MVWMHTPNVMHGKCRVAGPTEWLYKTGNGVSSGYVAKKCMHWPFQQVRSACPSASPVCVRESNKSSDLSMSRLPVAN